MNLLQIHEPGQTPLPHSNTVAVGIDLGTTHSVVAVASYDDSGDVRATVIQNIHGHVLVPSVVYYAPDGSVDVGYSAKKRHDAGELGAVASIKRRMHEAAVKINVAGRELTPVEISADILRALKHNAEKALGKEVLKAVITVPAYFDDAARSATKDAARLAGLEVLRLINEPTAAALAYGLDNAAEGIYAIYDLGGGTFDISILKMEKGVFQVLATAGDTQLGGDDFDAVIPAKAGIHSRIIKERLSTEGIVEGITRIQFEALITPLVDRTIACCKQALSDAKLTVEQVKGVVMVGGSTRVPLVQKCVGEFFGKAPLNNVNPDEVVAVGAAIQAHGLTQGSDNLLLDVIPLSLCLETMGGISEKIIERNTPIPASVSQEFTTYQDNQNGMQIHVVQGEREMVADNRSLAKFELAGIPALPAGIARVTITFTVDADGLLSVSAQEKTTGISQTVHVKPSYGLSPEQIGSMLTASMEHARGDITQRLLTEARVDAERAIIEIESAIKQDQALLQPAEHTLITRQIALLRQVIDGEDRDYIDAETQELGRLAQAFAERRMNARIELALGGKHINKAV